MSKHSGLSRRAWLKTTATIGAAMGAATACSSSVSGTTSAAEDPKASPVASPARPPAEWQDRAPLELRDLRVTLSEPVLVKRSRWYCWFPSLMRQPDGTLWAIMSAYADIDVSDSFNYLSRSRDGGLTWDEPRVIGDAGLSHLLLPDGSAVVMPKGVLALSGGRPGVFVWFSTDGRGGEWQATDIVAHHNACRPEDFINPDSRKGWINRDDMIRQGLAGFSSCYTELMRLDDCHLLLIYDRLGLGWHQIPDESPETNSVWVVRITLDQ